MSRPDSKPDDQAPSGPHVDPSSQVSVVASGLPELPEELTSFGAAIAGDTLYVYGGHTGNAHSYSISEQSNRLWSLDLDADDARWQKRASGPRLQGLALVPWNDSVVRIGGFTAANKEGEDHDLRSQASVALYDPDTEKWGSLPDLPEPRSSLDAAVLGDHVYVFGGWHLAGDSDVSQWHQTAWKLDLNDPQAGWQALAEPPFQRRALSVAAFDGKLYVIGGMRPEGGPTTRVDVYDPASDRWSKAPALPGRGMSGFGSAAFAAGDRLYVSTMDGFVHRLAEDGQSWTTVAKTDPARFFHRMLPAEGVLLMVGGANMEIGKFTHIDEIRLDES
jgi:N-acetylneuraminic acid mutarotase